MNDGRIPRKCQVVLLDERRLDFLVQPRLLSSELLDMVSSHFNLHEKEYFGLFHTDDTGNTSWLNLDRKVLDHDLPRYADPVIFNFAVRFYVPSITYLKEKVTVEIFYLQAKSLVFKGNIHCESDIVFELGAHVLQAAFGDFSSENAARNDMKKVPMLPTRTLKEHPSITYCEDMVIGHYQKLKKMKKGQAIVQYLSKFRNIPTYGVHYYDVKDKGNIPWWLGFSSKGVGVYDHADKTKPRKIYKWQQVINLDFKERKFSVEVKDLRKISEVSLDGGRSRSNSLGRRNNAIDRGLMHAWYASTTVQAKAMWTMAISQHQFYLDKKEQEDKQDKLTTPRTLEDIANELSRSGSLNSSLASVISDLSEPSETSSNGGESGISTEIAQKEMIIALAARKEALEMRLKEKTEELKRICFQEAQITGEYPPETPRTPNCPLPPVKTRVGTKFTYSDIVLQNNPVEQREEKLQKLERELEIQSKITEASEKLSNDAKASKNVKKSRKLMYQKSLSKLKSLEQAIKRLKESQSEDTDDNSLNSCEDEVDSKLSLTRRDSFNAATRQRKISNTSSIESLQSVSRVNSNQAEILRNGPRSSEGEVDLLALNPPPEFALSTQINEMLYRNKSHYRPALGRLDSNTSISSMSSTVSERLRPPPPSYSESQYSKRQSSLRPPQAVERRGSAPGLYSREDEQLQERHREQKIENHRNNNTTASASTKVRYVGGLSSPTAVDNNYNTNNVRITLNDDSDAGGNGYWLQTSARNRLNVAASSNYYSKLGIMSNSESTGSYHLNDRFFRGSNFQDAEEYSNGPHLFPSTSAIDISKGVHHSHNSLAESHSFSREPLMRQFMHDDRGEWSDEGESCMSLV